MYYCNTPDCLVQNKKWEFKYAQDCPECKQPLVQQIEYTAFERNLVENYPYVIAYPFKRMLHETIFYYKFSILKDVFMNTLKYMALVVATEYFRSPFCSKKLNTLFREKLGRPQYGDWNQFIERTIDFLELNKHSFFVKEFSLAYHSLKTE